MPINYMVVNQGLLVVERWQGFITLAEHAATRERQLADDNLAPQTSLLLDAQSATLEALDGMALGQAPMEPFLTNRFSRCALIVKLHFYEPAARMAQRLTAQGTASIAFVSLSIACTWVGLDVERAVRLFSQMATPESASAARLPFVELDGERLLTGQQAHGRRGATGRRLLSKLID